MDGDVPVQATAQPCTSLQDLPGSLLAAILRGLSPNDLLSVATTSKELHQIAMQLLRERVTAAAITQFNSTWKLIRQDQNLDPFVRDWKGTMFSCSKPDRGMQCIAGLLPRLACLVQLDLSFCYSWVDDDALRVLAEHAPACVRHLNLDRCSKITDKGMTAVCCGPSLSQLESLVLSGCYSTGSGVYLSSLTSLTFLDVSWCEHMNPPFDVCERLKVANFKGCTHFCDASCTGLSQVEHIDISFTGIKDASLRKLFQLKSLQSVRLGARSNNIYSSSLYSDQCLAECIEKRPDVYVKILHA